MFPTCEIQCYSIKKKTLWKMGKIIDNWMIFSTETHMRCYMMISLFFLTSSKAPTIIKTIVKVGAIKAVGPMVGPTNLI